MDEGLLLKPDRRTRRLLALYPRAWRERYGEEMADLLAREELSFAGAIDLLLGALDAHLHLPALLKGWCSMEDRIRRTAVIVLGAAAIFAGAVAGLAETRDQVSFAVSPARLAGALAYGIAWTAMAVAGLLCVLAALIATGFAVRWMEKARCWRPLSFVALPPLAVLVALASRWGLARLAQGNLDRGTGHALYVGWLVVAALCAVACVYAAARLLGAVELPTRVWRLIWLLTWAVIVAIAVGAIALLAYLLSFALIDESLLSAREGVLATALWPTLIAIVLMGLGAAALAVIALRQGGRLSEASRS